MPYHILFGMNIEELLAGLCILCVLWNVKRSPAVAKENWFDSIKQTSTFWITLHCRPQIVLSASVPNVQRSWTLFQYKDWLSMYGISIDKTVVICNGNSWTGKTSSYWDGPLVANSNNIIFGVWDSYKWPVATLWEAKGGYWIVCCKV